MPKFLYLAFCAYLYGSLPNKKGVYAPTKDISPMKVINREERAKTFTGFLTGLCAVIGGTLTVAAAVDRGFYEGTTRLKNIRSKDL